MRVLLLVSLVATMVSSAISGVEVQIVPYNDEYICHSHFIGEVVVSNESNRDYDISWYKLFLQITYSGTTRGVCVNRCGRGNHVHDELILQGNTKIRIPIYIAVSGGELVFSEPGEYDIQAILLPRNIPGEFVSSDPVSVIFIEDKLPPFLSRRFLQAVDSPIGLSGVFVDPLSRLVRESYIESGEYSRVVEEYLLFQMGNGPIETFVRLREDRFPLNRSVFDIIVDWNRTRTRHEWSREWVIESFWEALDDFLKGSTSRVHEFVRESPRWR